MLVIIAEGHVKMTLGSDIWLERPVTLKAISIVNRRRRREDQEEPRGITAHVHCRFGALLHFLRRIRLLPEKGHGPGERSHRSPEVGGFVFLSRPREQSSSRPFLSGSREPSRTSPLSKSPQNPSSSEPSSTVPDP